MSHVQYGIPIESNGAIPINVQDQHTEIVDLYLHNNLAELTMTADMVIDDTDVDVLTGHGAVAGDVLCFKGSGRYTQVTVLSSTATNIVFDTPIDFGYAVATGSLHRGIGDLAVDGALSPVVYHITPPAGVEWDITRLISHIEDSTAMDDGLFGGMGALTNGIVVRVNNGIYKNIMNVKTNGEFEERAYNREYIAKPPAGTGHAMNVRRTFAGQEKNGVTIRLSGDLGDELQIIIQDDLTDLDHFHCVAQGHVVTD